MEISLTITKAENHENSDPHRSAALTLLKLSQGTGIKSHLTSQFEAEVGYGRKLLNRIVKVVKSLRLVDCQFEEPHKSLMSQITATI